MKEADRAATDCPVPVHMRAGDSLAVENGRLVLELKYSGEKINSFFLNYY